MLKKILGLAFLVTGYWFLVTLVYAADETLTITTYYPSPYGSYREVSAYRMKIGETYSDAAYSVNDNNLIVEGNVGIGTASPVEKLQAAGAIKATFYSSGFSAGPEGTIMDYVVGSHGRIGTVTGTGVVRPLALMAGNAEYVRITTDGNVGIGTISPAQKLDVAGNMQANIYYDKDDTTYSYRVDPNGTSNVYRMSVNYTPAAANDVITKQYADNNYKDPPGQWTCTVRYGEWKEYANCPGGGISTAYCVGNEKVINGGGDGAGIVGWPIEHGWRIDATAVCTWGGRVRAAAYCCQ